jgi:hypothetical protein
MFLLLAEEHVARLKAEAQAQDHRNRLRVAQEQLAEYAAQKQQDAADVLSQADALQAALTALLQQAGDSPQVSSAAEALTRLKERLEDVAQEAEAFAKQQVMSVSAAWCSAQLLLLQMHRCIMRWYVASMASSRP